MLYNTAYGSRRVNRIISHCGDTHTVRGISRLVHTTLGASIDARDELAMKADDAGIVDLPDASGGSATKQEPRGTSEIPIEGRVSKRRRVEELTDRVTPRLDEMQSVLNDVVQELRQVRSESVRSVQRISERVEDEVEKRVTQQTQKLNDEIATLKVLLKRTETELLEEKRQRSSLEKERNTAQHEVEKVTQQLQSLAARKDAAEERVVAERREVVRQMKQVLELQQRNASLEKEIAVLKEDNQHLRAKPWPLLRPLRSSPPMLSPPSQPTGANRSQVRPRSVPRGSRSRRVPRSQESSLAPFDHI